ncbi:NAD(P)-binding domain-containing protein, partial [Streptomyces sp. NPDC005921]
MQLGLIGLGKMGGNMRERIRRAGHTVIGYDRNPDVSDVKSLEELVEKLDAPRVVWVMVPAGHATQSVVDELKDLLSEGDTVVATPQVTYLRFFDCRWLDMADP